MKIEETDRYLNWNKTGSTKSFIKPIWDINDIQIEWTEVIQTEEVISGDVWDIYTTDLKNQLSVLHKSWNIPRESVLHYMSFSPILTNGLEKCLEPFENYSYNYNLLKLTAGHMVSWHFDTYATFVKKNDIVEIDADKIKRSIIMLTEWNFGHILQIGNDVISKWKVGDIYTWTSDTWHGACNFGKDDFIIMQVTYIE